MVNLSFLNVYFQVKGGKRFDWGRIWKGGGGGGGMQEVLQEGKKKVKQEKDRR